MKSFPIASHAYWFKPKRIGYGAYPTTWEGWLVIAAYTLMLAVCVPLIVTHRSSVSILVVAPIAVIVAATVALFVVCKKKTDGPLGWNTGARHISGKND